MDVWWAWRGLVGCAKIHKRSDLRSLLLFCAIGDRRCGDNGGVKSWVEISGERLVENLRAVQAIVNVGAGAEVLGVVKGSGGL